MNPGWALGGLAVLPRLRDRVAASERFALFFTLFLKTDPLNSQHADPSMPHHADNSDSNPYQAARWRRSLYQPMSPPMTTSPPRTAPVFMSLLIEPGTTEAVIGNSTGAVYDTHDVA